MKDAGALIRQLKEQNIRLYLEDAKLMVDIPVANFYESVLTDIRSSRQELIDYLQGKSIGKAAGTGGYPLSSAQHRLWVVSQLEGGNLAYIMPAVFVLEGELNEGALERSFQALLGRHEILRTVFRETEDGEVLQWVKPLEEVEFSIEKRDLQGGQEELGALLEEESGRKFDLTLGQLLRAQLYRLTEKRYVFAYTMHHIISDGWSMGILLRELLLLYGTYVEGGENPLPPLRIQYKDYAQWQRNRLASGELEADRKYWREQLSGVLPVLELPGSQMRPLLRSYRGGRVSGQLDDRAVSGLRDLCRQESATLFMGLLGMVYGLLHRYTGEEDIILGSPIAGRDHWELEEQLGFYVNTLPLRVEVKGAESYRQLLRRVRRVTLEAYEHQTYPFDELVGDLQLPRDRSRNKLFDVMVVLQNTEEGGDIGTGEGAGGLRLLPYEEVVNKTSKFDWTCSFRETAGGVDYYIEYDSDLYTSKQAGRMGGHLENWLSKAVKDPDAAVRGLDYLRQEEKEQLLWQFNNTQTGYPKDKTIIDLLEEQVRKTPDKIALVVEDRTLTYRQLNEQANRLGRFLRSRKEIVSGTPVGVLLDRSEHSVIAMIGIMKANCIYVPLDKMWPDAHIAQILQQSKASLLIVDDLSSVKNFPQRPSTVGWASIEREKNADDLHTKISSGDTSYLIYTSGSTGIPKGVAQTHRTIYNLILWEINGARLDAGRRHLQFSSFSFDSSLNDCYYVLTTGGEIHLISENLRRDILGLKDYIIFHQVSTVSMPYAALKALFSEFLPEAFDGHGIREIISTGEQLFITGGLREFLKRNPNLRIHNLYGPSETHVVTGRSYSFSVGEPPSRASIGIPVHNTWIYILDRQMQLVPIGVAGDIYIGGWNLANGYYGQPELTEQRFIADPFRDGQLMYVSGDIGKWMPNGDIEYLTRRDDQLKIRGYRVELGEIEHVLEQYEGITSAVVESWTPANEEKELVAYIVGGDQLELEAVRSYIGRHLPSYMVPSRYVRLAELPLTTNGKVNRRGLPSPAGMELSDGLSYVGPRTETEAKLVAIWENILHRERIGIKDDFFQLGGHSLKMTRLSSMLYKEFGVRVKLEELFRQTTLEDQAKLIDRGIHEIISPIGKAAGTGGYPLSSAQHRLWVVSQLEGGNLAYIMPAVFVLEGELNEGALERSFQALLGRHEILRTVFRETEDGEVLQWVKPLEEVEFSIEKRDLQGGQEELGALLEEESGRKFDLTLGQLLRAQLYRLTEKRYVFAYTMHHIISDGWSMGILLRELLLLYGTYVEGGENPLPPLRIQYKDYAQWQRNRLASGELEADRKYWREQLSGVLPVLELPGSQMRPLLRSYRGGRVSGQLDDRAVSGLRDLCRQESATLFMGLLGMVYGLLHRYTGEEDIILGSPIAGRDHWELEEQLGFYVNTLPLRVEVKGAESYRQLLRWVRRVTLEAYEHQTYPFDELVGDLQLPRDRSRNKLFDVMVVLQNTEEANLMGQKTGGLRLAGSQMPKSRWSKFDLSIDFRETDEGIEVSFEHSTDIFKGEEIQEWLRHLNGFVKAATATPDAPVDGLDYLTLEEKFSLIL